MPAFQVKFRFLPKMIGLLNSSVFVPTLILALIVLSIGQPAPVVAADQYGLQATNLTIQEVDGSISVMATGTDSAYGIYLDAASLLQFNGSLTVSSENGVANGMDLSNSSTLRNLGSVTASSAWKPTSGAYLRTSSTLTNQGTISSVSNLQNSHGVYLLGLTSLTNSGTITGTSNIQRGYGVYATGKGDSTITNSGTITGKSTNNNANGVYLAKSSMLTNMGSIYGLTATGGWAYGVALFSSSTGTNSGR